MTVTTSPYRSGTRPGHSGFLQLLHAEWTKFRTVRAWVLGMVGAILLMVLVGLIGTAAGARSGDGAGPGLPLGPGGEPVNDSFYFVHQPLDGDGTVTVSVTSLTGVLEGPNGAHSGTQEWAKAGLLVKDGLRTGSSYAAVMVTPGHGVRMQYDYTHDTAGLPGAVSASSPRWLRLVRSGDVITGYDSADGRSWTRVGAARLAHLPQTAEVGMFVTSPSLIQETDRGGASDPAVATAAFGPADLQGGWSPGAWTSDQVGHGGTSGSYTNTVKGGYTESGDGVAVTGAGDIAPVVGGVAMGPAYTIENFLVGAFAGLIVMAVLGAVFITTEYRRGLILTTLAASPRRGRVLAAKVLVLGVITFVTGLVGAALAVTLAKPRARANGFLTFPVPPMTELRVVAGTGLLLAAAAVLALALGAIIRRSAPVVTIVIVAMVLPYILATSGIVPTRLAEWLLRVTPAAGFAIQQSVPRYEQVANVYTPPSGYYPLDPWVGFGVLCGYAVLAIVVAAVLLRRRDA